MHPIRNVLLIRLKSMGDILFTCPAVRAVREAFPAGRISFLVSREYASLLEGFPDVNEVIALDRAPYHSGNPKAIIMETLSLLRHLRREKFDLAVDFQGYGETALLAWCSGARQRWGPSRTAGRRWSYTRAVMRNDRVHPIEWNLSFLHHCGLRPGKITNEFALPEDALAEARRLFTGLGLDPAKPTLFIQPLTSSPLKNWPLANYLEVARHWRNRGLQILFGGGPSERAVLEPVREAGFPVSAGAPLLVAGGLLKLSTLVLGSDTGLLHLAVALGKRVVMIMASAKPGRCHPFQHADWTVTPAVGGVVSSIEAGRVIEACAQALAEMGPASKSNIQSR
jgi:ADP-heptose:LPS heptosyltransferase